MQVERRIERVSSTRLIIDLPPSFVNKSVEVLVLTLDEPDQLAVPDGDTAPNGARFASLAQELADHGLGEKFGDPVVWQREMRTDRILPGRE
ncbi:MAG: hypothetical protein SCH98_04875 [Deferrisomatales bacterium]|nr:hypothetical protein [Deferrisomatales bacterium]